MKYNYNDYELIDAIKNGEEIALEILLLKYDPYISHYIFKMLGHFDDDLIQEGRIILYKAIYSYIDSSEYSFFSYFQICFKRKIGHLIKKEKNYNKLVFLAEVENELYESKNVYTTHKYFIPKHVFENELDYKIYDECIIGGMTLNNFCDKYRLSYGTIYRKYHRLLKRIYNTIYSRIDD